MIQDIEPHKLDNHYYSDRLPKENDFVILYHNQKVVVKIDENKEQLVFPRISDNINKDELIYLFSIDSERFFLHMGAWSEDGSDTDKDEGKYCDENSFHYIDVRKLHSVSCNPKEYVFAAYTAMHLAEWYRRKQFCGKCGSRLRHDERERAMRCDSCGEIFYPRINPAVIVGVKNDDKLLLTRYRKGYGHNALVAGFTEIGETLEETVAREVMEETGLKVKNICYYKSQPWGIAGDLLAGFFCEVEGDCTIHMDSDELRYAEWVKQSEIELQSQEYSLTNEMMKMFKEGKI